MTGSTLLITRTEPKASAFAALMRTAGWSPLTWPLLDIVPVPATIAMDGVQAVLLTSAHAARALPAASLTRRPAACLCVGDATALAARKAGYGNAVAAGGDAAALAAVVSERLKPADGTLVFLRGETVAGSLTAPLREAGFTVVEHIVYRADLTKQVPPMIGAMLDTGRVGVVALHSPRGAAAFAAFAQRAGWRLDTTRAVCISDRTAARLHGVDMAGIEIAATADDCGMAGALRGLLPRRPA